MDNMEKYSTLQNRKLSINAKETHFINYGNQREKALEYMKRKPYCGKFERRKKW